MRKPRAIICEDDTTILDVLTKYLSDLNYEVLSCNNPTECSIYNKHVDSCLTRDPCCDILITDYKMPQMNGIELIQKQFQRGCQLDIRNKAIITGHIDDESREVIEQLGCKLFEKPFMLPELLDWLKECEKRFDLSRPLDNY
jgi:CheY-like chemotaxis protein